MAGLDFSWTVNLNFSKRIQYYKFLYQNQQNSTNRLEDISQNVDFGPKEANLDQKGPKIGGARFFPGL